jgi:hypothetical protein
MNQYRGDDRDYQDRVQRAQVRADDAIVMATGGSREVQLFAVADERSIMGKAKLGRRSGELQRSIVGPRSPAWVHRQSRTIADHTSSIEELVAMSTSVPAYDAIISLSLNTTTDLPAHRPCPDLDRAS